jgi:hypothetical protein
MSDPGAGRQRPARDQLLVLALDRRVGDLEDVEDAHRDVVGQLGQDPRHAEEADLALVAQLEQLSTVPSASICARLGDMWTCTRSSRSVRSLRRLCSTPARTLAAL